MIEEVKLKVEAPFEPTARRGRRTADKSPTPARTPHVARLMALAIHLDQLIRDGHVKDQAELAELGHVTRARITQILNLLSLAPDIQEALLFVEPTDRGLDRIKERDLRPVAALADWQKQRRLFALVLREGQRSENSSANRTGVMSSEIREN